MEGKINFNIPNYMTDAEALKKICENSGAAHVLEKNYEKHFRKTMLGKEEAWRQLTEAMLKGDNHGIYCANNHRRKDRIMVDAMVFSTFSQDLDLWVKHLPIPYVIHSKEHLEDIDFVRKVSKRRDEKIDGGFSEEYLGLNEVSWFLRNYTQQNFVEGKDYLKSAEELTHIYKGNKPKQEQQFELETRPIKTLRDGARFVRNDPAIHVWADWVVDDLLAHNVQVRQELFVRDYKKNGQFDFTVNGGIDIKQMIWEVALRISRLSFRTKHLNMYPRPEQVAWDLKDELISQAFNRGAPDGHGDFTAMHAAIYEACGHLIKIIFDKLHLIEGKTVGHHVDVLVGNGADWRISAGVHTPKANRAVRPLAHAVAERVANERLSQTQRVYSKVA